jgi:hypothetical protein
LESELKDEVMTPVLTEEEIREKDERVREAMFHTMTSHRSYWSGKEQLVSPTIKSTLSKRSKKKSVERKQSYNKSVERKST